MAEYVPAVTQAVSGVSCPPDAHTLSLASPGARPPARFLSLRARLPGAPRRRGLAQGSSLRVWLISPSAMPPRSARAAAGVRTVLPFEAEYRSLVTGLFVYVLPSRP